MTTTRGPTIEAVPNVLQDQTIPNTLNGVGAAIPVGRSRPSNGVLAVAGAAVAAIVALVLARFA
jgi:hypothetical protein